MKKLACVLQSVSSFVFLQPIAVEVFSGDGRNYLLAFQKGIRNKVYQRSCSRGNPYMLLWEEMAGRPVGVAGEGGRTIAG